MIVLAIIFAIVVTPSRVCGLKLFEEVYAAGHDNVTPSRVCGLKHVYLYVIRQKKQSHTLTGVWIETHSISSPGTMARGHTLTGVWIETTMGTALSTARKVTPSRVCGLKHGNAGRMTRDAKSHPPGCVV